MSWESQLVVNWLVSKPVTNVYKPWLVLSRHGNKLLIAYVNGTLS